MKQRRIFSLLMCLGSCMAVSAQTLPLDSCIRKGKLANGLTYYIRHNDQTPGQADFYIAQRVGSILEQPEQRGLAHFLEHMAFNGTRNFPDGNGGEHSVRNWCERNGIKFGADLNAYTSIDQTVYNISNAPVSKDGVTDTCLIILHDWAGSLLLKDNEIDQERGVIREEWRTRRSRMAAQRMMENAMPVIYAGSKYADCLPMGNIQVVDTFHYDTLRDYYHKWYRPDLQGIIVVGDINVDDIETKIKNLFGADTVPANAPQRTYYSVPDNKEMIVYTQADKEQPTLNLSLYMKHDAEPRETRATREAFLGSYKSKLAMFILRQRLAQLSHEAQPRVMSASCRAGSYYVTTEKDAFALNIGLMPNNPQAGIDAAIEIVEKARRYGFTEAELEHAKVQHTVNIEHRLDNKNKTRNAEYAKNMVSNFCSDEPCMNIEYEAALEAEFSATVTLDGIKVSARQSDIEPNRLTINMFRLGGRSLYPDSDAPTLQFLGSVVKESGAADFDFLTLEKKRRGKALRVVPYIDAEEEGVKGVCVASDFKTWLQIMYLYLTNPRKDKAIFQNMIAKQQSMLRNRNASPNVTYNDSLRVAIYGQRKRTQPLTADRLNEVDFDRIYQIYHERFSNLAGMNLIVTGDIREDDFEDLLCQYVASLPGKKSTTLDCKPGPYILDIQPGQMTKVFSKQKATPSAQTNIVYSAPIAYTADTDLKLDVLAQIMRSVYTEKVREEKGGTYGVSVDGQFWKYPTDGCSMTISFRCDPNKYDELLPIIDQQLQLMAAEGPTEEQLETIKEYERKNYHRAVLTNGWWEYVRYHELREGIDFDKDYLKKVDSLTTKDIRNFCKLLTAPGNRIQVTMK